MTIFILQKSITDLKAPVRRCAFHTEAETLQAFLGEMIEKNARTKKTNAEYIRLFDEFSENKAERFVYERKREKFSVPAMQEFAYTAFADKLFLVKNVTQNVLYEDLGQRLNLHEGDEIALIRLKFIRGPI